MRRKSLQRRTTDRVRERTLLEVLVQKVRRTVLLVSHVQLRLSVQRDRKDLTRPKRQNVIHVMKLSVRTQSLNALLNNLVRKRMLKKVR